MEEWLVCLGPLVGRAMARLMVGLTFESEKGITSSTTTNPPLKGNNWDINTLKAQPEILSFPSISLRQFELAMAAQAAR
ncbi:hypothetical protein LguiA_029890 [Lonicera macranthoides]